MMPSVMFYEKCMINETNKVNLPINCSIFLVRCPSSCPRLIDWAHSVPIDKILPIMSIVVSSDLKANELLKSHIEYRKYPKVMY